MKVIVYVEGKGDHLCLETLLRPLLRKKEDSGVSIQFVAITRGDSKKQLLTTVPMRAAITILNDPQAVVVILPDLYPANKGFTHTTCEEMQDGIRHRFTQAITRTHTFDERLGARFHVFCLIHDLEVLLLAAEEQLMTLCRLSTVSWTKPVEQQNHEDPPKRVMERLIAGYQPTVDGPRVLSGADYQVIRDRCPRGFGRFVSFLESVSA